MNWIYKAAVQMVLARVPFGENINYMLQRIKGGHSSRRIDKHIRKRIETVQVLLESQAECICGGNILEVGTGWEPIIPILLSFLGAEKIYTFDHVRHCRYAVLQDVLLQVEKYFPLISQLSGLSIEELSAKRKELLSEKNMKTLLKLLNIEYVAPGDAVQSGLPDNSLDLFFSYATLEHVPEQVVKDITREALRVLKPGAIYYNYIGLHDHYARYDKTISKVNFLKYNDFIWRILAQNKVSYLNRLRCSGFISIFRETGFEKFKVNTHIDKTSLEALKTMTLARKFRGIAPEDLATDLIEIIAYKPDNGHYTNDLTESSARSF